jgi:hypothetical protein
MKWYVEGPNGDITLYDSGGYDTVTRVEKRSVTPEICATFARQKTNATPRRITTNVSDIQFFDPNSGRARVWYSKAANGTYELFDTRGFNPATSEPLLPVTKEVVAEIMTRVAKETEDRKRIEGVEAKKRAEAEQARNRAAEAEAKRRAAAASTYVPPPAAQGPCPGIKVTHKFGLEPARVNPNGQCATDLWYEGHCLYMKAAGSNKRWGPICGTAPGPNDAEWIWSADTPFDGYVRLSPPRYQEQPPQYR